jgi:hypothetical protein
LAQVTIGAMTEPERYLLLALSLLVARQRNRARGEPVPYFFRTLRQPLLFQFTYVRDSFRCPVESRLSELFFSSVLVAQSVEFVSPVSGLGPHVGLMQVDSQPEVKLSRDFADWLGLSSGDPVYAVYSPLQVFYTAETGFFLPHRESWHAYAARCVAARIAGARYATAGDRDRVHWPEGAFEAGERSGAAFVSYEDRALRLSLQVGDAGFDLSASAHRPGELLSALRKFCHATPLPEGIRAAPDGPAGVRIQAGIG